MQDDILKEFICLDCNVSTHEINEYYILKNQLWANVHPDNKGMLCIGCVEDRLGRKLNKDDFLECPLNSEHNMFKKSDRLLDRLNSK